MQGSATGRVVAIGAVVLLHVVLLALLTSTGTVPPLLPAVLPIRAVAPPAPPPPPAPRLQPTLEAPPALALALPEIRLTPPPAAPRAVTRAAPAQQASHFGAATDSGLGLDVAPVSGGGAGTRGTLAGFEAAVRARVLAGKRQPSLAWDRRDTCVVNYRVSVARGGGLAGYTIDPCAVQEINQAARDAIAHASLPAPPDLGASSYEVHGSLIFHP